MIAQIIRLYCMKNDLDKAWLVQLALIFTFMFTSLYIREYFLRFVEYDCKPT